MCKLTGTKSNKFSLNRATLHTQVTRLVVTEVRSTSFGLALHAQHIYANCLLIVALWMSVITTVYYVAISFIIKCDITCFLCAMHVIKVRASFPPPKVPLCQTLFHSWPPLLS